MSASRDIHFSCAPFHSYDYFKSRERRAKKKQKYEKFIQRSLSFIFVTLSLHVFLFFFFVLSHRKLYFHFLSSGNALKLFWKVYSNCGISLKVLNIKYLYSFVNVHKNWKCVAIATSFLVCWCLCRNLQKSYSLNSEDNSSYSYFYFQMHINMSVYSCVLASSTIPYNNTHHYSIYQDISQSRQIIKWYTKYAVKQGTEKCYQQNKILFNINTGFLLLLTINVTHSKRLLLTNFEWLLLFLILYKWKLYYPSPFLKY